MRKKNPLALLLLVLAIASWASAKTKYNITLTVSSSQVESTGDTKDSGTAGGTSFVVHGSSKHHIVTAVYISATGSDGNIYTLTPAEVNPGYPLLPGTYNAYFDGRYLHVRDG